MTGLDERDFTLIRNFAKVESLAKYLAEFWWACESGEPEGTRDVRVSDGDRNLAAEIVANWIPRHYQAARCTCSGCDSERYGCRPQSQDSRDSNG